MADLFSTDTQLELLRDRFFPDEATLASMVHNPFSPKPRIAINCTEEESELVRRVVPEWLKSYTDIRIISSPLTPLEQLWESQIRWLRENYRNLFKRYGKGKFIGVRDNRVYVHGNSWLEVVKTLKSKYRGESFFVKKLDEDKIFGDSGYDVFMEPSN